MLAWALLGWALPTLILEINDVAPAYQVVVDEVSTPSYVSVIQICVVVKAMSRRAISAPGSGFEVVFSPEK